MDIWVDSTSAITNGASINTEFLFAVLRAATLRAGLLGPMATPCAAVGRVALSWPSQQRRARPRHPCATLTRRGLRSSVTYPGSHGGGRAELGLQAGPGVSTVLWPAGRAQAPQEAGTCTFPPSTAQAARRQASELCGHGALLPLPGRLGRSGSSGSSGGKPRGSPGSGGARARQARTPSAPPFVPRP